MPEEITPNHTEITMVQGLSFILSCWLVSEPHLQCGLQGPKEELNPPRQSTGKKIVPCGRRKKERKLFGPVFPDPILNVSITHHLAG